MTGGMEVPLLISLFESFSVWLKNKQKTKQNKTKQHTHTEFAFCPHGELR
jgi:hypothetical protein